MLKSFVAVSALALFAAPAFAQTQQVPAAPPAAAPAAGQATGTQPAAAPAQPQVIQASPQGGDTMMGAQMRLQNVAQQLQTGDAQNIEQVTQEANRALDEMQQALQGQSGQDTEAQVMQIQQQIEQARQQLAQDPTQAAQMLANITQGTQQLQGLKQAADVPAESDRIIGKTLMTTQGQEAGEVSDVLVTTDGQVAAILVQTGGALGMGGRQVAVEWDRLEIQGDQLTVQLSADEVRNLPEYKVE